MDTGSASCVPSSSSKECEALRPTPHASNPKWLNVGLTRPKNGLVVLLNADYWSINLPNSSMGALIQYLDTRRLMHRSDAQDENPENRRLRIAMETKAYFTDFGPKEASQGES